MSDLVFKCSVCSKNLAVNVSLLGRRFICPECRTKIHAPTPALVFPCPACGCELAAPEKLAMQDFECPNCEQKIVIPEVCVVSCPSCNVNVELEMEYFAELAGSEMDCPECGGKVAIEPLPGTILEVGEPESDDTLLPKGFGHKTMKLDNLITGIPQAQRLDIGICPYCSSKVHALHGNSYVCKSCGRIMRKANRPSAQGDS
jgi:DNA-directed RNA polymerase subunit RPC12/RpoP